MKKKVILDLCGGTGSWSEPYRQSSAYKVILVTLPDSDVRLFEPPAAVHGILAAPPCTQFAVSGARHWRRKDTERPELLREGLEVVFACLRIIEISKTRGLKWWALENPVGRLPHFIGPYAYSFQPYEYGDPWLKRTCIWGWHQRPQLTPVQKPEGGAGRWKVSLTNHLSPTPTAEQIRRLADTGMIPADWIHRLPPSADRATLRSITPPGWARAFFKANP